MQGVKEVSLVDVAEQAPQESQTIAPPSQTGAELVLMFERLAKDSNVDVEKLERLINLQERIMLHQAKAAFDTAFSKMQPEIPVIDEHGKIEVKGTLRSTYAPLEDIHEVVKPITARFGFSIRHRTEWPEDRKGIIRVVGILSHEQGHREESVFEAPMDRSDYRTDIQSMGSTVSYGRRYTTMDLLNIATRKADTDGQRTGRAQVAGDDKPAPQGYEGWQMDMEACADEGWPKLSEAFTKASADFRKRATGADKQWWQRLKEKAERVAKGAQR